MLTLEESLAGFPPPEEVRKQWGWQVMNNCYLSSGEGVVGRGTGRETLYIPLSLQQPLRIGSC